MRWIALSLALAVVALPYGRPTAQAADPAEIQFFEQRIRPVLVKECYKCHSAEAKKLRGNLRLDARDSILKGGDTGPALVPGKPTESLLIKALRHDGLEMPPTGKLPDAVVADFERWVQMGAPDPRIGGAEAGKPRAVNIEEGRKFWAFQPPRKHPVPQVKDASWPRGDLDRFVLAALEAKGLKPVRDADRATLIRRVTIDLIGLPPSPQEIDAFLNDGSPEAFDKVVDRLLASPHFGERWGRHWLDVARYADSNGKDENLTFHEAYRYRDYVIDAFNRDKPYDRFVMEQIAGDLMKDEDEKRKEPGQGLPSAFSLPSAHPSSFIPHPSDDELLTATGFLVVGPKVLADRDFLKRKMDVVDEQVDTIGKAFMGLTLGCARCHDHKFDPIPTKDYYALAGIFASTRTLDGIKLGNAVVSGWMLRPLGGPEGQKQFAAQKEHQKKLTALADQIKKTKAELKTHEDQASMRIPGKLVGVTVDNKDAKLVGQWKPSTYSRPYVGEGYIHDDKQAKGEKSAAFTPKLPKPGEYEVYVSYTASKGRSTNTPVIVRSAEGEKTVLINQEETPRVDGLFRLVGKYRFEAGQSASVTISNKDTTGYVIVDAVRFVPVGALADDKEMAMGVPDEVRRKIAAEQEKLRQMEGEEKKLKAAAPPPPRLVMAVRDEEKVENLRINIRGNPHQLGEEAPRGFLTVVASGSPDSPPADQSGRLQLARWLVDRSNPLTARLMVNRVWKHLFGEGLVRSVDNFGVQGEKPSHPELLDQLAIGFMEDGWSVKRLIRRIVLSRVYQLSSAKNAEAAKVDPENRLLARANRRRVEAEVIRDAILAVSGKLDHSPGGPVVAHLGERAIDNDSKGGVPTDANFRRAVYLPIVRNDVPQIFEVFDFADPEVTTGKRDTTTVATQALFLMNNRFVLEQARHTAQRLLASQDDAGRLAELYRRALGRVATQRETEEALRFVAEFKRPANGPNGKAKENPELEAWSAVVLAVFGCTEFRFIE